MNHRAFLALISALFTAIILTACGGGGGGGGGTTLSPPIGDISGDWSVTETITSTDCPSAANDAYTLSVSQNVNTVNVYDGVNSFQGVLDGNILRWSGSYYESGGYNTINTMALTVASDCNSLGGDVSWSWSDGTYSCSGTTAVSANRINPVGCSATTTTPTDLSGLAGTWYGSIEDMAGTLHTLSVTIDTSGNITSTLVDGTSTGTTATITADATYSQVYDFLYSDGTSGGFIPDSAKQHAAFIDDAGNIGVVQKGATSLPTYSQGMLTGSWSGLSLTLDSSYTISSFNGSTSMTADASGNLSGSDIWGSFTGTATLVSSLGDASYGRYYGSYNFTGGTGGNIYFLTPDGMFAASYAGTTTSGWPTGLAFSALSKQ